jgi:hypothetical protein
MTAVTTERAKRGPSYDRHLIDQARERRRYGDSYRVIAEAFGVPVTTAQYWTQAVRTDKSGRWQLADAAQATEPDVAIVIKELHAVRANSGGRVTAMTRDEARWVTLLARARPDIAESGPGSLWQLARSFIEAISRGDDNEVRRWEIATIGD